MNVVTAQNTHPYQNDSYNLGALINDQTLPHVNGDRIDQEEDWN